MRQVGGFSRIGALAVAGLGLILAMMLAAGIPASGAESSQWPQWAPEVGGEFRTAAYEDGEFVYRNGIYQALGPNVDGLYREDYFAAVLTDPELPAGDRDDVYRHLTYGAFGVDRSTHNGDYELPRDRETWPDFTADLAVMRLQIVGDDLVVWLRFTSMPRADAQIATLTFDSDGLAAASREWPNGAGVSSPWQTAVTVWGTGGQIDRGNAPADLATVGGDVTTDVERRTMQVRVPLSELPAGPWRMTGGAGLADPSDPSRYWDVPMGRATDDAPGSGANAEADANVWSLLFADDEQWTFDERRQSDLLADGDVTEASVVVDPARLIARVNDGSPSRTGRLSRWYISDADLGDGIERDGGMTPPIPPPFVPPPGTDLRDPAVGFLYRNDLQPYFMYVPEACLTATCPLIVWMHGANNHPFEPFGLFLGLEELLEERGYLFASVLGRGDTGYSGVGELDVLDVIDDVSAAYDVDPRRVHLMGLSMGSGGTHHLATRNPDIVASASGFTLSGSLDLLANLRHVKYLLSHGREDFFDPNSEGVSASYEVASALGYDAVWYDWLAKTHDSSTFYDIGVPLFDRLDHATSPRDPAQITFIRPVDSEEEVSLGLVHDRAYWLSDITSADPASLATVSAASFGIPHPAWQPDQALRDTTFDAGLELPSGRGAHQLHTTTPVPGPAVDVANRLELSLEAVTSVEVSLARARLDGDGLTVQTDSTEPATVGLAGLADGAYSVRSEASGEQRVAASDGVLSLQVAAGVDTITITAVGDDPLDSEVEDAPTLPTTGGGFGIAAIVALGAGWRTRASRRR